MIDLHVFSKLHEFCHFAENRDFSRDFFHDKKNASRVENCKNISQNGACLKIVKNEY